MVKAVFESLYVVKLHVTFIKSCYPAIQCIGIFKLVLYVIRIVNNRLLVCSVMQVEYKLLLIELHIMKSLQVDNTASLSALCLLNSLFSNVLFDV